MTSLTVGPATTGRPSRHLRDATTAELTKLRSVRSGYWSLLVAAVLTVGIGALAGASVSQLASNGDAVSLGDPTAISLSGLMLGQLIIAGLGIKAITAEYSTGLIRTSLAAVPRRRTFLLAKAAVVGSVTLTSGVAISLVSFLIGQAAIGSKLSASLGDPGVARAVVGGGLLVSVVALVGLGLGTVIRHTAGTVVALVSVVFVLPGIVSMLGQSWSAVERWMLPTAGEALMSAQPVSGGPSTGRALLICLLWVAGTLGAAAYAISKRDA